MYARARVYVCVRIFTCIKVLMADLAEEGGA